MIPILEFIISFIIFVPACLISFYIPGVLLLSFTKLQLSSVEKFIISWVVGISVFMLGIYTFAWIHFSYGFEIVLLAVLAYVLLKKRDVLSLKIQNINWWAIVIIILGIIAFTGITMLSGLKLPDGLQFVGISNKGDGIMHMAFIKSMMQTFPPVHAGLSGYQLRGYHYFYDFILSRFSLYFFLSPEDLHYRLFPIFMAFIYGVGFYLFTKAITKDKTAFSFVLFFAYFGQSFAFIYSLINKGVSVYDGLGVVQPIELILDPSVVLSIGMILVAMYLMMKIEKSLVASILLGIILGTMSEFKVYIGIIGILLVILYSAYSIVLKRKTILPFLISTVVTGILTLVTFFPNNFGAGNLWFSPFFIYESFMQEHVFNQYNWELIKDVYQDHHNIPRLIEIFGIAIGWYWLLALGLRLIFILGFLHIFKKKFWSNDANLIFIALVILPILIGSLFVQSISIFDTKQFFWIAAALFAIPAGVIISEIWGKSPIVIKLLIYIVLLWYIFGAMQFQFQRFISVRSYTLIISNSQLAVYKKITHAVPESSFIVVVHAKPLIDPPNLQYHPAPLVSAYTSRVTFYEPEVAQFSLTDIFAKRTEVIWQLTQALNDCDLVSVKNIMHEIGSPYLVTFTKYHCVEAISSIVYTADGLDFYKIKQ